MKPSGRQWECMPLMQWEELSGNKLHGGPVSLLFAQAETGGYLPVSCFPRPSPAHGQEKQGQSGTMPGFQPLPVGSLEQRPKACVWSLE